jgi:hypothetical protein
VVSPGRNPPSGAFGEANSSVASVLRRHRRGREPQTPCTAGAVSVMSTPDQLRALIRSDLRTPPTQDPPSSVRLVCRWSSRHLCTLRTRRSRPVRHRAAGMRPLSHDNGAPVLCLRVSDHHAQHRGPVALSGLLHAARRDVRSVPSHPHHRSIRHRRRSGSLWRVLARARDDMSGLRQGRALSRRTQGADALLAMSALAGADMQSLWSVSFTNRSVARGAGVCHVLPPRTGSQSRPWIAQTTTDFLPEYAKTRGSGRLCIRKGGLVCVATPFVRGRRSHTPSLRSFSEDLDPDGPLPGACVVQVG